MEFFFLFMTCLVFATTYSQDCKDKQPHCKAWKTSGYCDSKHQYYSYMSTNCKKECGFCSVVAPPPPPDCFDKGSHCQYYKDYCNHVDYISYVQVECKLTCNYCHITTTAPPTTVPTKPYTQPGGRDLQPGCGHKGPGHTRIVGGTNAKPGSWPWIANIDFEKNTNNPGHWCGGTLITDEWVLSAAHCFDDRAKEHYSLKLGEHNLKQASTHEQAFNISELIIHPNYDGNNYDNDLALLRLDKKASLNTRVRTACLPDHKTSFQIGTECYLAGWGLLKDYGVGPAILQQAKVPLVDQTSCKNAYATMGHSITNRMFCAGFSNGTIDSCQGDSGGPLVCKKSDTNGDIWYLWGTVSWGVGCARQGLYGVYASPLEMRRWIDTVVFKI